MPRALSAWPQSSRCVRNYRGRNRRRTAALIGFVGALQKGQSARLDRETALQSEQANLQVEQARMMLG